MFKKTILAATLTALAGQTAQAHVVLTVRNAPVGAFYTGAFHVGHGCGGSATTALRVEIPAAIRDAKPQPKAGWTLQIEHEPLATPVKGEGGEMITTRTKHLARQTAERRVRRVRPRRPAPGRSRCAGVPRRADLRDGRDPLDRNASRQWPAAPRPSRADPDRHAEG